MFVCLEKGNEMLDLVANTGKPLIAGNPNAYAAGVNTGMTITISVIVGAVLYVLLVIAWWKMFTKAGEKGWKAIIPFYNWFIMTKLTWSKKFFWITFVLAILVGILASVVNSTVGITQIVCSFIVLAIYIALLVFMIIFWYRISKSYGHGGGFTVGLIFLNFIFMLILGFGKSEYKGNVYLKEKQNS